MRFFKDNAYQSDADLLAAVERYLRRMSDFPMWTVGTTRDPRLRREELDEPAFWCSWEAESAEVAEAAKDNLLGRGMKADPGGKGGPSLYVF